jgi:putative DNA methylase
MTDIQPRVLIEDWLPVKELGIESRRERAVVTTIPPLNWLHVWWARRPLVASAAVVLGGLLPAWTQQLADEFPDANQLQTGKSYRRWFLDLVGIWGDPVTARRAIDAAKVAGVKLDGNGYGYKQAYKNGPERANVVLLHQVLVRTWGELPTVADPTAGGGSIPFTATRLGLPVFANDLNPIAASLLRAGVEFPAMHGVDLAAHLEKWGGELVGRVQAQMQEFFPLEKGEQVIAYICVNAVACPRTARLVPLLTNKWLRKEKGAEVAVHLVTDVHGVELREPLFKIVTGSAVNAKAANAGIVSRGDATSPYDNLVIDGEYIKAEAQAGRMSQILYAVAVRTASGARTFRAVTDTDRDALVKANAAFAERRGEWESAGLLPTEEFPEGNDMRPRHYGMTHWLDFFTPRQALVHGTFSLEFAKLIPELRAELGDLAEPVLIELALIQGKALNWNSRLSSWDVSRQKIRSVFDRHDFAFKWTFAEFEGGTALYGWCLDRVVAAYQGISELLEGDGNAILGDELKRQAGPVTVTQGSAGNLSSVPDCSFAHVCMDPPYYDNVMYAELADFFYVWEKRTLGKLIPEFFTTDLTDKENEAVANPARFAAMGRRKKELATLDYEAKMTAIFSECRRTLRDDGVLSVMFTHKRAEAWDTLGMGLLQGGFTIETSWPVNSEAENSLHQANMNSAASTIMLVCRKRPVRRDGSTTFLDDIEGEIRAASREAVTRFQADGIEGVDLLLSTYGPTLSVISQHWPVYSSTPDADGREQLLRPEQALDLAREEVVRLRRTRLIGKSAQIDDLTDFVLMAWDIFGAREFPFDTARLLALAVGGLEVDDLVRAKVLSKKTGTVSLLAPAERVRHGADSHLPGVRPEASKFDHMVDAVDTVLYVAEHDGSAAAKRLLDQHGFINDESFLATVQGLVNAIPRSKVKGDWVVPEAGLLDILVTAYLPSVTLPADEPVAAPEVEQGAFDLG